MNFFQKPNPTTWVSNFSTCLALAAALAAGNMSSTLFLIACGAIPTVDEWERCSDEDLRTKVELIARQRARKGSMVQIQTLATHIRQINPSLSINGLISACCTAALGLANSTPFWDF